MTLHLSRLTPARTRHLGRLLLVALAAGLAVGMSACGSEEEPSSDQGATERAAQDQAPTGSGSPAPSDDAAGESTAHPGDAEKSPTKSTAAKDSPTSEAKGAEGLAAARETFAGLVPGSLFDRFDSCTPNGLEDSVECSGREVGQFQFFKSDTKAASTTQVLTELRSSRVVEDRNNRVVGWSTLGNTAILTVADNDRGLVAQQMVSTDQVDPKERIFELGLAEKPAINQK